MMDDCCVSADSNFIRSQPCNTLADILNILACNCHDNIIHYSFLLLFGCYLTNKLNCLICMHTVSCVNLSVMDTRYAIFTEVFFLETAASRNGSNIRQLNIGKTKNILDEPNYALSVCLSVKIILPVAAYVKSASR